MSEVKKDDGGPAFACAAENGHQPGMTLRDYFAGHALGAFASSQWPSPGDASHIAQVSYAIADAMLAERSKESPQ